MNKIGRWYFGIAFLACVTLSAIAATDTPPSSKPVLNVPAAAQPGPNFDVKTATDAWLATVPADKKAKSDAYFEGGYWLQLWDFLLSAVVLIWFLQSRLSARLRDWAEQVTTRKNLQTLLYFIPFLLITSALQFPLVVYEGFFREHNYGLANQTFWPWFGEQMIGLAISGILGGIAIVGLFALVRRLGKNWWIWGAVASIIFQALVVLIYPVLIAPRFNTYKPLANASIKNSILSMAHANGIPVNDVYEVDASRQTNRVSANVSGFLGSERITLNDNLLNRCTPEEIQAVMGHEMGHYVMNHLGKTLLFLGVFFSIAFAFLNYGLQWALARWGDKWGIRNMTDVAVLPLAVLILSVFGFLTTPVTNSWTRAQEYEADIFGLNASRQPDGEAAVDLKLGDYRKLDPGPIEEMLFYDHPSGRTRITAAMRWKKENQTSVVSPTPETPADAASVPSR
jgi:STE24 endopeptidase